MNEWVKQPVDQPTASFSSFHVLRVVFLASYACLETVAACLLCEYSNAISVAIGPRKAYNDDKPSSRVHVDIDFKFEPF